MSELPEELVMDAETLTDASGTLEQAIKEMSDEVILKFFRFAHLPERLQAISAAFAVLAVTVVCVAPRCAERTMGLRKLLEGKDCAVRALLP